MTDPNERWWAVGAAVSQRLHELGWTTRQLEEASGISRETLRPIVTGRPFNSRSITLARISQALGWTTDSLENLVERGEEPERADREDNDRIVSHLVDQVKEHMDTLWREQAHPITLIEMGADGPSATLTTTIDVASYFADLITDMVGSEAAFEVALDLVVLLRRSHNAEVARHQGSPTTWEHTVSDNNVLDLAAFGGRPDDVDTADETNRPEPPDPD